MAYVIHTFVFLGILPLFHLFDNRFKLISNFFVRGKYQKLIGLTVATILLIWLLSTLEIQDYVYLITVISSVFASITIIANRKPTH